MNKPDKLTIEHLAPYLPYGLKITYEDRAGSPEIVRGVSDDSIFVTGGYIDLNDKKQEWKPILRPLSNLTKFINHNGLDLLPVQALAELNGDFHGHEWMGQDDWKSLVVIYSQMGERNRDLIVTRGNVDFTRCQYVQKLLKWHFDVFGLIDAGLAVDINTIEHEQTR